MVNTKFRIVTTIQGKEGECGRGASILSVISFCYRTRQSVQNNLQNFVLFGLDFVSIDQYITETEKG